MLESAHSFQAGRAGLRPGGLLVAVARRMDVGDWITVGLVGITVLVVAIFVLMIGRLPMRIEPKGSPTRIGDGALPSVVGVPPVAPTPVPSPTTGPPILSVVDAGGSRARLRAEPGLKAEIVERLPDGAQVVEIGPQTMADGQTWQQVTSPGGKAGWIAASLLRRVAAPSPTPAGPPQPYGR